MLGYPAVINVQVDKEEDKGIQVIVRTNFNLCSYIQKSHYAMCRFSLMVLMALLPHTSSKLSMLF